VIGSGTFQPADSDRLAVNFVTTTDWFARTRACTTKYARHNVAFTVQQVSFVKASLGDQTNIGSNISMGRTPYLARNIRLIPVGCSHDRLVSWFQLAIGINHTVILSWASTSSAIEPEDRGARSVFENSLIMEISLALRLWGREFFLI
jgi:hypothetical protein